MKVVAVGRTRQAVGIPNRLLRFAQTEILLMADRNSLTDDALKTGEWKLLAATVREFENACMQGDGTRNFDEYLPAEDDPLRQPVLVELIKVDQELSWNSPPGKSLESYLQAWPELAARPSLVADLLRAEFLVRTVFDAPPNQDEIASRFPDLADQIDLEEILEEAEVESAEKGVDARETRSYRTPDLPTPMTPTTISGTTPQGFQVGQTVAGRYEILEVLGQGAWAPFIEPTTESLTVRWPSRFLTRFWAITSLHASRRKPNSW